MTKLEKEEATTALTAVARLQSVCSGVPHPRKAKLKRALVQAIKYRHGHFFPKKTAKTPGENDADLEKSDHIWNFDMLALKSVDEILERKLSAWILPISDSGHQISELVIGRTSPLVTLDLGAPLQLS